MKQTLARRSDCPINFSLETFGDMWSLLIVRDIVYFGKKTYGEFLNSDEKIATNILARRLAQLEHNGIICKTRCTEDRRKELYALTEKGLDLIPVLLELAQWGAHHDPCTGAPMDWIDFVSANRDKLIPMIRATVERGGSIFVGEDSVISQLATGA